MRKLIAAIGLLGVLYALSLQHGLFAGRAPAAGAPAAEAPAAPSVSANCSGAALADAYRNRQSRVEVCGNGVIVKVLKDDLQGSRHQRFIVRLPSGQTVLIAHNIDVAPRIDALRSGPSVEFSGEYEWNEQGGVVHWTHHDPASRHSDGWLRYEGQMYR